MDAVLALRLLSEIHREFSKPLHAAYVDIKAAFDSVDREALWKAMKAKGTPPFLLHVIRDLRSGTTSSICSGRRRRLRSISDHLRGVRQGCILDPALFCCAIDWIMSRCTQDHGVKVDGTLLTDLDYADVAVLFSDDASTWPNSLQRFDDEANNMHTSWAKTKVQNIGCGSPPAPVTVVKQPVDSVEKFTYLGSDIDSSGRSAPDMLRRIGLTSATMSRLVRVFKNKRLSLTSKLRIYNSCVLPVLLYGSEAWTLLREDGRRLQAFHMRC